MPATRSAWLVLILGALTVLAAVAFPLAPVAASQVEYRWPVAAADPTPAAVPLMPYQPVELVASVSCAAARAADGRVLLATTPADPDPAAFPLAGLRIAAAGDAVLVRTADIDLGAVALPPGECRIELRSTGDRTLVERDGVVVLVRDGDVRPAVAGVFTEAATAEGLSLRLTADTRFATSPSPLKIAIGAIALLALAGMLWVLGRADAAAARRVRLLPRDWWRPRAVDGAVGAGLGLWWVVGAITVDDGYIAGIVRSRDSNGFIGNVYRWLNAPEAPFSWFYDVYVAWSALLPAGFGTSTPWLRLPSVLLGLLCWGLVSRLVLPRLGRFAARRTVPWVAAVMFGVWWVPFNLGLRPEPWVAVGLLAVFLAVERAIATRRLVPLAVALLLASLTTAVTPAGLAAFAPILAATGPLVRLLRARRDLHVLPLLAALAAAPSAAVLLMAADQSLAGLLDASRVRLTIGGGLPWFAEPERYALLFGSDGFQGAIGRRAAVAFTVLAALGLAWALLRGPAAGSGGGSAAGAAGFARGPAGRMIAGFGLALLAMTLSPTKWTQHFGDLAGYGAAILTAGAVAWSGAGLRARPRTFLVGFGLVAACSALVLAGKNSWPYVSAWWAPTFSTVVPQVGGFAAATLAIGLGGAVVAALVVRSAWYRAGADAPPDVPRLIPTPAVPAVVVLVAVLAVQVFSFVRVVLEQPTGFTLAADALATARGEPCGLQRDVLVETDPAAGVLPAAPAVPTSTGVLPAAHFAPTPPAPVAPVMAVLPAPDGPAAASIPQEMPVDVGGSVVVGVRVAGRGSTAWQVLAPEQRDGSPVVVFVGGALRPGDGLAVEFGRDGAVVERRGLGAMAPVELRLAAPAGADTVRLAVDAPSDGLATVSLPRTPRLTPMLELLPLGTTAILDWPVAFLFGCLTPQPLPPGAATIPKWRVGPPLADPSGEIMYSPRFGGPFAGSRLLVTQQRMPGYLRGDLYRDPIQLYRWSPRLPLHTPAPEVTLRTLPGWADAGPLRGG